MARTPDIHTDRLLITPFTEHHLTPRYLGWLRDSDLMKYSEQRHKTHTLDSCRAYWHLFEDTPHFFWAIQARDAALGHIGNINAYLDLNNALSDVGILIGEKEARHQKFGLEAWIAVCHFLFTEKGMRKITAGTVASNRPMLKLMQSAGMTDDGTRKKHFFMEGREVDIIYKALYKSQWDTTGMSNRIGIQQVKHESM